MRVVTGLASLPILIYTLCSRHAAKFCAIIVRYRVRFVCPSVSSQSDQGEKGGTSVRTALGGWKIELVKHTPFIAVKHGLQEAHGSNAQILAW